MSKNLGHGSKPSSSFFSRRKTRQSGHARRGTNLFEELEARRVFAAFTAGDIAVLRLGDGSAALSNASTAVFIDEYNPANGHLVQTISLPTANSGLQHALTSSGSGTGPANVLSTHHPRPS